ncbi:MAG: hypothetical protein WDO24_30585 [Pseudomonadota bacterium]
MKEIGAITLAEPIWDEKFEEGELSYANVYSGKRGSVRNVAFLAFSTPRGRNDAMLESLQKAGIEVHVAGDCLSPREMLAATEVGHAIGNSL